MTDEASVMSAENGIVVATTSQSHPTAPSSGKRKREDTTDEETDKSLKRAEQEHGDRPWLAGFLSDVLTVLKRCDELPFRDPTPAARNPFDRTARAVASRSRSKALVPFCFSRFEDLHAACASSHDPNPSILDAALPSSADGESSPAQRNLKRPRVESSTNTDDQASIASKIKAGLYSSLKEVAADVELAGSSVLELSASEGENNTMGALRNGQDISRAKGEVVARVLAFKKVFASILLREKVHNSSLPNAGANPGVISDLTANASTEDETATPNATDDLRTDSYALSLFGSAPQPRQLFSSLQTSAHLTGMSAAASLGGAVDEKSQLLNARLPNGISIAKITPAHPAREPSGVRPIPTIGEMFPPPPTLPHLTPPKPSKLTMTRGPVVSWFNPADPSSMPRSSRRGSQSTQPQLTGQWLNYTTITPATQPTSPEAKRRQRERALSFGESKPPPPQEEDPSAFNAAREEALFRRVYSSFGPSRDDSSTTIPEAYKNKVWWDRIGRDKYEKVVDPYYSLQETKAVGPIDPYETQILDEEYIDFSEAVEAYTPLDPEKDFVAAEPPPPRGSVDEREVEAMLKEISELLQRLHSYQRIRNLSLMSGSRSTVAQENPISTMIGTPAVPSQAEVDVYNLLKSQLSVMVATLPPYAVARLNGDQLADLNISSKIAMPARNYCGVMEPDDGGTRLRPSSYTMPPSPAKARTSGSGVTYQSPQPGGYQPRSGYGSQTPASRAPVAPPNLSTQYYPKSALPHTPAVNGSRAPSSSAGGIVYQQSGRGSRGQAASANRAAGSQATYSSQTPVGRPPSGQYGQTTTPQQYYPQQQRQTASSHSPSYPAPQLTVQGGAYQRPSQPQYQQNAQQRLHAQGSSSVAPRTGGRRKSSAYNHTSHSTGSGPAYATPASSSLKQASRSYLQPAAHGAASSTTYSPASSRTGAPGVPNQSGQVNGSSQNSHGAAPLGASGFYTYLTPAQQASMMERQRAQLAAQQQRQQQPNGIAHTYPRPPAANGLSGGLTQPGTAPTGIIRAASTSAATSGTTPASKSSVAVQTNGSHDEVPTANKSTAAFSPSIAAATAVPAGATSTAGAISVAAGNSAAVPNNVAASSYQGQTTTAVPAPAAQSALDTPSSVAPDEVKAPVPTAAPSA